MTTAIKQIKCSKSEDLLNTLNNKNNVLWNGTRQFWVFRGNSVDDFKLIPSALRQSAKLGYTHSPKNGVQANNEEQVRAEFDRLHEFYWSVDAQGLSVPIDGNLLRTPESFDILRKDIEEQRPCDKLLPLLALAQHYGVSTRLLDWTHNPLIAAHFAAKGHIESQKGISPISNKKNLGIWGLNLDWIINDAFPSSGKTKMAVYVVTAPRASNPNLHAQGGVFTTEILNRKDQLSKNKPNIKAVNEIVEERWKKLNCSKPVMMHVTLPCGEAAKLLRLLHREGIDAATLFPGYKGVAEALDERAHWDKQRRTSYWMR
jgi:hypothetical protein